MKFVFERIDHVAQNGDICEHLIDPVRPAGRMTLCGLRLAMTQPACGNKTCKRCDRIAREAAPEGV